MSGHRPGTCHRAHCLHWPPNATAVLMLMGFALALTAVVASSLVAQQVSFVEIMKPSITVRVRHWGRIRVFCPRRTLSTRPFESSGSCSRRPTAFLALLDEVLASSRLPAGVHGGPEVAVVDLADLVVKGTTTERHDQHAEIIEVRSQDGSPPYVVRWLVTDHEATVYPGSDAVVVTAAEHTQAAERASARASRVGT